MVLTKEKSKSLSFFPIQKTNALKGLFAIMVLIHHIGQNTVFLKGTFGDHLVDTLGYLSVSMFLFLSGYGLSVSYKLKGKEYIKAFPKTKILPLYIQNLILIAIYLVFWKIIGKTLSTKQIILSFFFGHTVIKYGWYLQATLLLYFLFYIAFKAKTKLGKISIFTIGYIVYFVLCHINNCWDMWYISVLAFSVGVIYANIKFNFKHKIILLLVVFLILYIFANFNLTNSTTTIILKMASSVVFPVLIISIFELLDFEFKALNKVSKISLEIYVLQGLFLTLFHSSLIYIKNEILYVFLAVISIIIFSILLNKLFSIIIKKS